MKKLLALMVLLACLQTVQAQNWSEWFKQKKTQIKYLVQQIAALQVYTDYLEKGYAIAKDGLTLVNDLKTGDFNLHNGYFQSLKTPRPAVGNADKLSAIVRVRGWIVQERKNILQELVSANWFSSSQVTYIKNVVQQVERLADNNMDEVEALIAPNQLEMTDDQRWLRIDQVYQEVMDKYAFIRHFGQDVRKLSVQRKKEQVDMLRAKSLHGQ